MVKFTFRHNLVACVAVSLASPALAVNLTINAGFETGDFSGWTRGGDLSSTTVSPIPFLAHGGSHSASLGPFGSVGFLSQNVPTVAGENYRISFWLKNEFDNIGNSFTGSFSGVDLFSIIDANPFPYTKYSFITTATSAVSTLSFSFRNDSAFWYLDDVAVSTGAIPEPASWALMIIGFGFIGGAMRQRVLQTRFASA